MTITAAQTAIINRATANMEDLKAITIRELPESIPTIRVRYDRIDGTFTAVTVNAYGDILDGE